MTTHLRHLGVVGRGKAWETGHLPEDDIGRLKALAHFRQDLVLRKVADVVDKSDVIVKRQIADFELKRTMIRHDVQLRSALDQTGMHRCMRRIEPFLERAVTLQRFSLAPDKRYDLGGEFDSIHSTRRKR